MHGELEDGARRPLSLPAQTVARTASEAFSSPLSCARSAIETLAELRLNATDRCAAVCSSAAPHLPVHSSGRATHAHLLLSTVVAAFGL